MTRSNTSEKPAGVRPAAVLATAALVLGLAASAWAGPGRQANSQTPNAVRDAEAAIPSGVSVAIDPATGKVRQPTPAEVEALDRSFKSMFGSSLSAAAQPATVWPDGTVALALTDEYLNIWVARINPDGSMTHGCVDDPDQANAFIAGGAPVLEEM